MPVVPRRQPGQIATAPLPGVRVSTDAPASAFGVPGGGGLQIVGAAADVVGRIAERARQEADDTAHIAADNQAAQLQAQLQIKASQLQGKDALGAPEQIFPEWEKGVADIANSLSNNRQRQAFQHSIAERSQTLYANVQLHVAGERKKYADQETAAAIENRRNDALDNYQDPETTARAAVQIGALVDMQSRRLGLSPEQAQAARRDEVSRVHTSVVSRFLTNDNHDGALAYYDKWKDQIGGAQREVIDKAFQESSVLSEGQKQRDAIIGTAGITRADAYEKARAIASPRVQQETKRLLDDYYSTQDAVDRKRQEDLLDHAYDYMNRGQFPPATVLSQLKGRERAAVDAAWSGKLNDDFGRYYDLRTLASSPDPREREKFAQRNLKADAPFLSKEHRDELVSLQASVRTNDGKADEKLTGFRNVDQMITGTLHDLGFDPNAKPGTDAAKTVEQFRRSVDEQIRATELATKKPISGEDARGIIDNLAVQGRVVGGGKRFVFQRKIGDQLILTIDQVPTTERAKIIAKLRLRGVTNPTNDQVLRVYTSAIGSTPTYTSPQP